MTTPNVPDAVERLRPCPFCGHTPHALSPSYVIGIDNDEPDLFSIGCVKCQVWHHRSTMEAAALKWNTRVTSESWAREGVRDTLVTTFLPMCVGFGGGDMTHAIAEEFANKALVAIYQR